MNRVIVCLLFALGCASSSTGVWREVSTPHFIVRTDLKSEIARRAAATLELNRDMLISAAWPKTEIPEWARMEVYILDGVDFQRTFGEKTDSLSVAQVPEQFYFYGDPSRWEMRSSLVLPAVSSLRFLLAHRMGQLIYPDSPRWFYTGLSHFLETVHLSDDGKSVILGAVNASELRNYAGHRTASLVQLLAWARDDAETNWGLEGMSWLFVHWLSNARPQPFSRYRGELMRGAGAQAAFTAAFSGLDVDATDKELFQYSKHGEYDELTAPLTQTAYTPVERPLTPSDLHMVQARFARASWVTNPGTRTPEAVHKQFREQVDQALALDPTNVSALWADDWSPVPQRLTRARAAAAAHPDDSRAWELLGSLLDRSQPGCAEEENAYRRALALAPNSPYVMIGLAWLLQDRGRWSEAMPLVMKAIKRAPTEPFVLDTYAAVMFKAGSCTNALAAQLKALGHMTNASRKENPQIEKRLADYRTACAQRGPKR